MAQRITNSMMINTFNRNLQMNASRMERFQNQLATNRKIVRLSDDPVGVIKSIGARAKLNDIEQFKRNVEDARASMTAAEVAVTEVNTLIKRAYELSVQAANDTLGKEERLAISNEIRQLRDHLVMVGNSTLGDKFIFGGYNVTRAPFKAELADTVTGQYGTYEDYVLWVDGSAIVDPDGSGGIMSDGIFNMVEDLGINDPDLTGDINRAIRYQIGFDIEMDVGIGPVTLMGAGSEEDGNIGNIFKIFNDFANALNGFDEEGNEYSDDGIEVNNPQLQPFLEKFQKAQDKVLAVLAELGGRQNRLDLIEDRYSQDIINYTQMISDVEDLDQAEAIMHYSMQEAVYRAALSVGSRVIQPTLVDFLRY